MRMGAEKGGTKSGGFFHLFDWNRKSRKKLFSNGTVSPECSKQEKRSDNSLPSTRLRLDDEDDVVGASSVKGSSDYSCASSVTDEGFTIKPSGVVARLMGLDTMPTSGASEPISTPFFDSRFLREKQNQKRSPEFCINDQFSNISHRTGSYTRKSMELRSQKLPSSPIERFQTETIPPRSAKSVPLSHHKLLSPIKNSGFISGRNAAHIMEAAAKILDPRLQPSMRAKVSSFGSSSIPLKVHDSKESMMATQSQRTTRILESARMPADLSDVRYLRGQPVNRCWTQEDSSTYRRSSDFEYAISSDAKSKGKSISLAIQAKVNVQRREGLSSSSRKTPVQRDQEECRLNQSFKSQPNHQKNKQQRKPATTNASGVLRQNNQKQNCLSNRSRLPPKQSVTNQNQNGRKVLYGDNATSTKNRTVSKLSVNSRVLHRKEHSESANLERISSTNKDFPQKKRLIERSFLSEKDGFADSVTGDRHQKHVQPNVVIDECSNLSWVEDSRSDGADVVSFTFTSPLIKPTPRSASSRKEVEKWDKRNIICYDTYNQKNNLDVQDKKASSHGLNGITGDALSVLLEQKLRELTSGVGTSNCSSLIADSFTASTSVKQERLPDFDSPITSTAENGRKLGKPCRNNPAGEFHPGVSSTNGLVFGLSKLQRVEEIECSSSSSDARKEADLEHLSPLSTLESSFSNESIVSTDSSGSSKGSKVCTSSVQAKNIMSENSVNIDRSPEILMELSDSATSTLTEASDTSELTRSQTRANYDDLHCVRERSSMVSLDYETLDHVLGKLENESWEDRGKDGEIRRKVLFDCVNECLDLKCSRYFRAGYKSWSKGVSVVGKNLAEELYEEISGWKSMGDCMVDEMVDRDMSTHRDRWVDFEIEAFEAGREFENEILSSLVDEIIADYSIRVPHK